MKSDSGSAALAVKALEEGDFDEATHFVNELEHLHTPRQVRALLAEAGAGLAYLRQASLAALRGEREASARLRECASRYVGEDELFALAEEHRLTFVVQMASSKPERRVQHGFVSAIC
jgi:hypothetical protein